MKAEQQRTRLLLWIAGLGATLLVLGVVAIALMWEDRPAKETPPRPMVLTLGGAIADAPNPGEFVWNVEDRPAVLTEYTEVIRAAGQDDEISELLIQIEPVGMGWASLQELRDALLDFAESGKPCVAYGDMMSNREYYLATACTEIYVPPAGLVFVNGLASSVTYYADALEKVGVSANFAHVGDYKSAVEPYERTGPSESAEEATNAMLDSLYGELVKAIAAGRGLSLKETQRLIDDPPMTPEQALEQGLVDGLLFRDEAIEARAGKKRRSFKRYLKDLRDEHMQSEQFVAIIHADGAIVSGDGGADFFGGRFVGDVTTAEWLESARKDDDVKAVVLRINSPGGSGLASDNIWRAVELLREKKPVVVSMGDYAASGGYYIAMGGDVIFAEPSTLTGSIGVFGGKLNFAGAYDKIGVTMHHSKRGEMSDLFSSTQDFSESGRARYEQFLESFYGLFLQRVALGRDLDEAVVHEVAQGRVWTGLQAHERGLVDAIGGMDDAVRAAAELAEIHDEDYGVTRIPSTRTFWDNLVDDLAATALNPEPDVSSLVALIPGGEETLRSVRALSRALEPTGVAAMLDYTVEIR